MTLELNAPLALLGGISPAQFMREYWQKKPLLVRAAVADFRPPVLRAELLALAQDDAVQVRRLQYRPGKHAQATGRWDLEHGPVQASLAQKWRQARHLPKQWTLLVQSVNLYDDRVADLMAQFRFIPDARLDDLMISMAGEGGGVGPHFDSYDVFLLQAAGTRRWSISAQSDLRLLPDLPLKILQNFVPESSWDLQPGDMLYLPPQYAHDGVAVGAEDCMTYSIGFRSPQRDVLGRNLLERLLDQDCEQDEDSEEDQVVAGSAQIAPPVHAQDHYHDPAQQATAEPAKIPAPLQAFAQQALDDELQRLRAAQAYVQRCLGESLSEPRDNVWFSPQAKKPRGWTHLTLHRCSQMLYDETAIYMNGQHWLADGPQASVLQSLANRRSISLAELAAAPQDVQDLLHTWWQDGWLLADVQ